MNHSNPERTAGDPEVQGRDEAAASRPSAVSRLSPGVPGTPWPPWVGFLNHSAKSHLQTCPFVMKKLPISPPPPS